MAGVAEEHIIIEIARSVHQYKMKCADCGNEVGEEYSHADYTRYGKIVCWQCIGIEK